MNRLCLLKCLQLMKLLQLVTLLLIFIVCLSFLENDFKASGSFGVAFAARSHRSLPGSKLKKYLLSNRATASDDDQEKENGGGVGGIGDQVRKTFKKVVRFV